MDSVNDIMQLCRLCLVKDHVNIPIFDSNSDVKQTLLKINSCLPVKVSQDDKLPKKICDGCSYKLEMLYVFRNTSVNSEKQLLTWIQQATALSHASTITSLNSEMIVKQEQFEPQDSKNDEIITDEQDIGTDSEEYLLQEKLSYSDDYSSYNEAETNTSETKEPVKKKAKLRTESTLPTKSSIQTKGDNGNNSNNLNEATDDIGLTKAEDDSDESDGPPDEPEFLDVATAATDDQPGPSGVSKEPLVTSSKTSAKLMEHSCSVCGEVFPNKEEFLKHHLNQYGETFNCCKCGSKFKTTTELYAHFEMHKLSDVYIVPEEMDEDEVVTEVVLNYDDATTLVTEDGQDIVYILDDDSQCVNEVVIEEAAVLQKERKATSTADASVVKFDHGYILTETTDHVNNGKQKTVQPSTSKILYINNQNKSRTTITPKRRHVVPDFSSTNYVFVSANEEVDIPHYKCLRCEQLFINKFVFFRHIEKGKCYINNCDVCSAIFSKNSEFYYHYIIEHTDRAICNFCFRTFMYEKNVKEHMLRHLHQFRHRCDECNKGFYTVREYRNHYKNRHMGMRHTCAVCARSFADEYYFKRHIATHEATSEIMTQ